VDRCNALWVIVDHLTKMAHFVECKETMGLKDLADEFLLYVVWAYGLPNSIISNRGSLFTSCFWKQIMVALGISRNLSTACHLEMDGQTEETNTTLEQYLCAYCNYQQDNWKHLLLVAESCYNNTRSEITGATPFFVNCWYHPYFQPDLTKPNNTTPNISSHVSALTNLHEERRAEIKYTQIGYAK
jgi:hypothetical protein